MFPARTLTHKTCYTATSITVLKNKGGFVTSLLNSPEGPLLLGGRAPALEDGVGGSQPTPRLQASPGPSAAHTGLTGGPGPHAPLRYRDRCSQHFVGVERALALPGQSPLPFEVGSWQKATSS